MARRIAVIGAGYAGLACAVELADAGISVDLFESSRTLGGRARAVVFDGLTVDNGAHILVGAYRETLRLLQKVGANRSALKKHPLHLEFADKVRVAAPPLPAPLHLAWALLTARGLSWRDKFAAIRFMRLQQARHFRLTIDITAADLLADQPERTRRYLWDPLCLAALNTPVAIASAQVFLNVLRDSLAADHAASDLLLPATDFSRLFPEPAENFIKTRGCRVMRGTRITTLENVVVTAEGAKTGWMANDHGPYDHLVLAVAPYHLARLLGPHPEFASLLHLVGQFQWQPIATVYLQYPAAVKLPFPMLGMEGGHAQWLFDRGMLCQQAGLIAVVISGEGSWQALGHAVLAEAVHREIAAKLPNLPRPEQHWVIEEKRATFACTPDLKRPTTATPVDTIWLAGDYVACDYPATLEAATRSGTAAARSVLDKLSRDQP